MTSFKDVEAERRIATGNKSAAFYTTSSKVYLHDSAMIVFYSREEKSDCISQRERSG